MSDENVLVNLEINQGGNAREVLRETATASRELARAGAEATGELTRAEVLYQDRLRQRGSILSTLASQQTRAGSQTMGSQERGRDNGAGVVSFGAAAAGYPAPQLGQSIQPGTYQVARPVIPAPILPVMPVLKVQVERPIIPAPVMSSPAARSASSIAATAEAIVARLPHFGTGGTVGGPTVAMIGERGPEAVVPLRRLADGGVVGPFYSRLQRAIEQQAGSKAVPVEAIKNRLRKTRESFSEEEWAAAGMESALRKQDMAIARKMARLLPHLADGGILPHLAFGGFKPTSIYQSNPLVPILAAAGSAGAAAARGIWKWLFSSNAPAKPPIALPRQRRPGEMSYLVPQSPPGEMTEAGLKHFRADFAKAEAYRQAKALAAVNPQTRIAVGNVPISVPAEGGFGFDPSQIHPAGDAGKRAVVLEKMTAAKRLLAARGASLTDVLHASTALKQVHLKDPADFTAYISAIETQLQNAAKASDRKDLTDFIHGKLGELARLRHKMELFAQLPSARGNKGGHGQMEVHRQTMKTGIALGLPEEDIVEVMASKGGLKQKTARGYLRSYVRESQELPRLAGGGLLPNLLSRLWQHWGGGQGLATAYGASTVTALLGGIAGAAIGGPVGGLVGSTVGRIGGMIGMAELNLLSRLWQHWGGGQGLATAYGASTVPALLGGIAGATIGGPVGGLVGSTVGRIGGMIGMAELLAQERGKPRRRQPLLSKPGLEELPHLASGAALFDHIAKNGRHLEQGSLTTFQYMDLAPQAIKEKLFAAIPDATFMTAGTEAIVLRKPDGSIVRIAMLRQKDNEGGRKFTGRPAAPSILQPEKSTRVANFLIEELPHVKPLGAPEELFTGKHSGILAHMRERLAEDNLLSRDLHPGNVAIHKGLPVMIDPGDIEPFVPGIHFFDRGQSSTATLGSKKTPQLTKGGRLPRLEGGAAFGRMPPHELAAHLGQSVGREDQFFQFQDVIRAAEARRQAASRRSLPEHEEAMAQAMAFVGGTTNLGRALRLLDHPRLKKWWRPDLDLSTEELHGRQSLAFIGLGPSPFLAKGGRLPRLAGGGLLRLVKGGELFGSFMIASNIMGPRPHSSLSRLPLSAEQQRERVVHDNKVQTLSRQISVLLFNHREEGLHYYGNLIRLGAKHPPRTEEYEGKVIVGHEQTTYNLVAGEHWVYDQLLKKAAEKHDFNFDWRPNEAIPEDFLAKGGRLPRLAAGGAPDGSLEAIAGEVAPELFRHKGRNYIVSNPGPGVHITMEPGDFVLPRGKRVEDLPRLAGGGALPRLADGGTHGAFPIGTGNDTNRVYIAGSILLPVKVANAHVLGGGGAGAGTGGGKGGALGLLDSPLSGVAAKMFMVVKAIQLLEGGLKTTAGMMNIYGDSMLSATQKTQMMSESIPVIGGLVKAFREFGEALSGLPELLQKGRLEIAQQAAGVRAEAEARQKVNAQDLVFTGAQAKWSSLRDAPMPDAGPLARQTYQEQLAYQKSQSLLPAKEKAHVAQADLAAAQAGYAKAQEQLRAGQANIKMYRADIDKKQTMADRLFGADSGSAGEAQRKLLLEQIAASEEGLARNKARAEADAKNVSSQALAIEQAKSAVRQNNIELAKAELAVLKQEEQTMSSQAKTVGAMGPGQVRRMRSIVAQIKNKGADSLTLRQRELVRGFAPEWAAQEDERRGQLGDRGLLLKEAKAANMFERGHAPTLKQQREKVDVAQHEVKVDVRLDEVKLAAGFQKSLNHLTDVLVNAMEHAVQDAIQKVKTGKQIEKANQN